MSRVCVVVSWVRRGISRASSAAWCRLRHCARRGGGRGHDDGMQNVGRPWPRDARAISRPRPAAAGGWRALRAAYAAPKRAQPRLDRAVATPRSEVRLEAGRKAQHCPR